MKTKFETNVASELPKTKVLQEPSLPWKVSSDDLEEVASKEDEYKATLTGTPPLKTRPIFLITLVVVVSLAILYFASLVIMENERIQGDIEKKEETLKNIQESLKNIAGEKELLSQNIAQLEKRVGDLNTQKEIFTTVIESLTKKNE